MDAFELRQLIAKPEWTALELKKSANEFPKDAASTICAFANSGGGYLVLGVDEKLLPAISGIQKDKFDIVQNQCLALLKDTQKFSSIIEYDPPSLITIDDSLVLVINIQDAKRQNKPVKVLDKQQWTVYLRKGARDEKASDEEIRLMLIDSNTSSATDQIINVDAETFFSQSTVKWYRKVYESRHNQKHFELSDLEFLDQLGLVRDDNGELKPTKAAVLMFGLEKHMSHLLSRKVVDAIWYNYASDENAPTERWADRRPLEDQSPNLFDAWRIISDRFMHWSEAPFAIDESNLHRSNETPDYKGFREAAVNILIHQDFSDHNRVPKISFYKDISVYWNPGDSLVEKDLLRSGKSASRNPLIIDTFQRIGLSDRAGSGLKDIYENWQLLNRPVPEIIDDKARKSFQITLGKRSNISVLQEQLKQRIGISLNHLQSQVFVACLNQLHTADTLAANLNASAADIYPALDFLSRQALILPSPAGYQAAQHFQQGLADLQPQSAQATKEVTKLDAESDQPSERVTNLTTKSDQARDIMASLSKKQKDIVAKLSEQLALKELMAALRQTHRTHFKSKQLQPLIDVGVVAQTYPENPNHQDQAYFLSELGQELQQIIEDELGHK